MKSWSPYDDVCHFIDYATQLFDLHKHTQRIYNWWSTLPAYIALLFFPIDNSIPYIFSFLSFCLFYFLLLIHSFFFNFSVQQSWFPRHPREAIQNRSSVLYSKAINYPVFSLLLWYLYFENTFVIDLIFVLNKA